MICAGSRFRRVADCGRLYIFTFHFIARFQRGFRILDALLHFETTASQMPQLGQISKYLTPVKIIGVMGKCKAEELDFRYTLLHFEATMRQRQLVSKIEPKFHTFDPRKM